MTHKAINVAQVIVLPSKFAGRSTSALLVNFDLSQACSIGNYVALLVKKDKSQAGSFCKFPRSLSRAACASEIFTAFDTEIGLCTMLQCDMET